MMKFDLLMVCALLVHSVVRIHCILYLWVFRVKM